MNIFQKKGLKPLQNPVVLDSLLNDIPSMIWLKDKEGRFLDVNKYFCDALGVSRKKVIGKTDSDIFSLDLANIYSEHDSEVLQSGKAKLGLIESYKNKDKDDSFALVYKIPYKDNSRNIVGTMGFAIDITEFKHFEQELKEAKTIIENSSDVIFIEDIDMRLRYMSSSVKDLLGYELEEAKSMPPTAVMTKESAKAFLKDSKGWIARALAGEKPDIPLFEYEYIRKDKSTCWCELRIDFLYDSYGKLYAVAGVIRNIDARKKAEAIARKKTEELELFNKLAVDRELKMIELKKKIVELERTIKDYRKSTKKA